MNEFRGSETIDTNQKRLEGFKEIKPEGNMNKQDAKSFVEGKFEKKEISGGSYKDMENIKDEKTGETLTEKHHMPPDDVSPLDTNDGPCIRMDKEDHKKTASWGSSKEAKEYRDMQKELINQGKFKDAINNDIADIRSKFGDKYEDAISQMMSYVDRLEKEGKI